jgi:hypothetical protein
MDSKSWLHDHLKGEKARDKFAQSKEKGKSTRICMPVRAKTRRLREKIPQPN